MKVKNLIDLAVGTMEISINDMRDSKVQNIVYSNSVYQIPKEYMNCKIHAMCNTDKGLFITLR